MIILYPAVQPRDRAGVGVGVQQGRREARHAAVADQVRAISMMMIVMMMIMMMVIVIA